MSFYLLTIFVNISILAVITTFMFSVLPKLYKKKSLRLLYQIIHIKPSLEMDKLLPQLIDLIVEVLNPLRCSIMLIDHDNVLRIKIGKNISNYSIRGLKLNPNEGIAGKAFETGLPVVVKDISESKDYFRLFEPEVKPVKKEMLIAVPIKYQDKSYGVINLHFSIKRKFFNNWYDKFMLKVISEYVSVVIHNSYTYFDAVSDSMTKLYNHDYIIKRLKEEMELAKKFSTKLSFVMFDIDHFKNINDTYGHTIGDTVITTIADVVKNNIRLTDIAGRYGGEEFCIILPHTSLDGAVSMVERIKNEVSVKKFVTTKGSFTVTCSFGVKEYDNKSSLEEFITSVDKLLYTAKLSGRNRICF